MFYFCLSFDKFRSNSNIGKVRKKLKLKNKVHPVE